MDKFSERERAIENKFAHDADLEFKVASLTHKNLGLWAAAKLDMSGEAANSYARNLVNYVMDHKHDQTKLISKLLTDFKAKNLDVLEHHIIEKYHELEGLARDKIMKN